MQLLDHPLRLRSTAGRGSRFAIEVPIADPSRIHSVSATVEQKVPNLIGGKLIVVIDDEESVRLGMQSLLESWGCNSVTAMDAAEALRGLGARTPDFIIADLRLRGDDNGIEAIRQLRASLGDSVPAVVISGDTATEQLRKVSAAGLTMMHKPLKAVRLRALLNHEFAKRERAAAPPRRRRISPTTRQDVDGTCRTNDLQGPSEFLLCLYTAVGIHVRRRLCCLHSHDGAQHR